MEEALAYTSWAAGCWMDFDEDGSVTKVVGEGLGRLPAYVLHWAQHMFLCIGLRPS